MFIVNQSGDICTKVKTIHYILKYDEETLNHLNDILLPEYPNLTVRGIENYLKAIKQAQENFIINNNRKQIMVIYVNETKFAEYKDINKGKEVFEKMIAELSSAEKLFHLDQ